jgi:transmembrane sensor
MTTPTAFSRLFRKYLDGTADETEKNRFFTLADDPAMQAQLRQLAERETYTQKTGIVLSAEEKQEILKNIYALSGIIPLKKQHLWPRIAAAASIVLALSAGGYFLLHKPQPKTETARLIKNDIAPGHNQATLTLAGGKKIILTKGLSGTLAKQGQTIINATKNNIIYNAKNKTGDQFSYNTLTTARGEQSPYPLVLADGTKVWLNAESSITFPTAFNQKERIVKVTGEAYFEVAHNAKQPFKVQTAGQTIEDIGTRFNVNAYTDESATRTTLIEGVVKVNRKLLAPGQQCDGKTVKQVNASQSIAWKNGDFDFDDDKITTVMRQLARWYDVDVQYEGNLTTEGFNAQISRRQNISVVLKALERTNGVRFKIEGRRVTVMQ